MCRVLCDIHLTFCNLFHESLTECRVVTFWSLIFRLESLEKVRGTVKIIENKYFTPCSSVSIVNFEQVNADWFGIGTLSSL